jgi:hypothetical protein
VVSLGIFSEAIDGTMCPGVVSACKNEYQEILGVKDGRCVRVTILPTLQCQKSRKSGSLTYWNPKGHPSCCKTPIQARINLRALGQAGGVFPPRLNELTNIFHQNSEPEFEVITAGRMHFSLPLP